jgi:hypothetical protein
MSSTTVKISLSSQQGLSATYVTLEQGPRVSYFAGSTVKPTSETVSLPPSTELEPNKSLHCIEDTKSVTVRNFIADDGSISIEASPIIKQPNHTTAEFASLTPSPVIQYPHEQNISRDYAEQHHSCKVSNNQLPRNIVSALPDADVVKDIGYSAVFSSQIQPELQPEPQPEIQPEIQPELQPELLPELQQLPLGKNAAEETAIFIEMLKPYEHLDANQKQVAAFVLAQHRAGTYATYGFDIDTEGEDSYFSSFEGILKDRAQDIDCEDYTEYMRKLLLIAKDQGYLPQDSTLANLHIPGHILLGYTTITDTGVEYYATDNNVAKWLVRYWEVGKFSYGLTTFKKYSSWVLDTSAMHEREVLVAPFLEDKQIFRDVDQDGYLNSSGNSTVADSISTEEIFKIQQNYIQQHGEISLPQNFDEQEYLNYFNALKYLDVIGGGYIDWYNKAITVKDLNITAGEAKYLIGRYSNKLGRELTVKDLQLEDSVKQELLKQYPHILDNTFDHSNLHPQQLSSVDDNNTQTIADISDVVNTKTDISDVVNTKADISDVVNTNSTQSDNSDVGDFLSDLVMNARVNLGNMDITENFTRAASSSAGAVFATALTTIFSKYKQNKILKRSDIFNLYLDIEKKLSHNINNHSQQLMQTDFYALKKLLSLTSSSLPLENDVYNKANISTDARIIVELLLFDKMPIDHNNLTKLVKCLLNLFQETRLPGHNKLLDLHNKLQSNKLGDFSSKTTIKYINSVLNFYGITIDFNTNKVFGSTRLRSNVTALSHRIKINTNKLYLTLQRTNKKICYLDVSVIINNNINNFELLNKLTDYEKDKLALYKKVFYTNLVANFLSIVPLLPTTDAMMLIALRFEQDYAKRKTEQLEYSFKHSIQAITDSSLTAQEKNFFIDKITQLYQVKSSHLLIKHKKTLSKYNIHASSFCAKIALFMAPTVAFSILSAVKFTAKLSVEIRSIKKRYTTDKKKHKNDSYLKPKDMYLIFKKSYLEYKTNNCTDKADAIAKSASILFDLPENTFESMVNTQLVETNRFKLNLYQSMH